MQKTRVRSLIWKDATWLGVAALSSPWPARKSCVSLGCNAEHRQLDALDLSVGSGCGHSVKDKELWPWVPGEGQALGSWAGWSLAAHLCLLLTLVCCRAWWSKDQRVSGFHLAGTFWTLCYGWRAQMPKTQFLTQGIQQHNPSTELWPNVGIQDGNLIGWCWCLRWVWAGLWFTGDVCRCREWGRVRGMVATHLLVICFLCCFSNLLWLWQKRDKSTEEGGVYSG